MTIKAAFRVLITLILIAHSSTILSSQGEGEATNQPESTSSNDNLKNLNSFDFVGGGDLNSLSNDGSQQNAGNISLGLHMIREFPDNDFFQNIEVDFGINISTTVDSFTISEPRSFGNYILNPINSRQSARLDFYTLFEPKHFKKGHKKEGKETPLSVLFDGAFFRFYGSNARWDLNGVSEHVTAIHWKLGLLHEFLPDRVALNSNSSVMAGFAIGQRAVTGDIKRDDGAILEQLVGSTKGAYWGLDLVFSVKFNNIRAEFIVPFVDKYEDVTVRGLTDTQFLTQVRFIGGFPLQLSDETSLSEN